MKSGEGNVTIEVLLDEGGSTGKLLIKGAPHLQNARIGAESEVVNSDA
jgi:hypothetical protein